jgi:hypothetical protein
MGARFVSGLPSHCPSPPSPTRKQSRGQLPRSRGSPLHAYERQLARSMPSAFRDRLELDRPPCRPLGRQARVAARRERSRGSGRVEGDAWPSYAVWERIAEFSGWPQSFISIEAGRPCSRSR